MASSTAKSSKASNTLQALLAAVTGNKADGINVLDGMLKGNVDIVRSGDKITLPEGMSFDEAITWLSREKLKDEAEIAVNEMIPAMPTDGAVALAKVLEKRFGFVSLVKTPGFFGDRPPYMLGVPTGPNPEDVVQAPWGRIELPGISGYLQTGATITDGRPTFVLGGVIKRADEKLVHDIATEIRNHIKTNSIYRAKAIKIEFNPADAERDTPFDEKFVPKFLPLTNRPTVILNEDARLRLETELYNPVRYSARCRKLGIPLKRGVLLEGPYGTGKTLTAYDLAAECVQNGWTFIYVENASALEKAISFASLYQPCVIFAEDIDKVIDQHQDKDLTVIRNALDSVETKNTEIAVVLTTNHIERLPPGFLRCGRIDSIVTISRPDAISTAKLARHYGGETLTGTDEEVMAALAPVVGQSAAVIRECVDRSALAAVSRVPEDEPLTVTPAELAVTAQTLANHTELLNKKPNMESEHPAVTAHKDLVKQIVTEVTNNVKEELGNS